MEIRIESVARGWAWRFYIPQLERRVCEGMTFPLYSTAVEDAKKFRKATGLDVPISYETPSGKKKVI